MSKKQKPHEIGFLYRVHLTYPTLFAGGFLEHAMNSD